MKPSIDLLKSLDRLYNTQEMQTVRRWLAETATEETKKAVTASGDLNRDVMCGRAQMLISLQELIETAPQALQRLENRNYGTSKSHDPGHTPGSRKGR
jgi:hypothetical protein